MLGSDKCFGPSAIESDEDKHEALGVEGRPAEEEGEYNNSWNSDYNITILFYDSYQACGWLFSSPSYKSWMINN